MTETSSTAALISDLRAFRSVVVITGAGISADSGIPTYRDAGSGWVDSDLQARSHSNRYGNHLPELWQFWSQLREQTAAAEPNAAHVALAAAEERLTAEGGSLLVATQNVDGLHQRAGSHNVIELHGSIHWSRCVRRGCTPPYRDARLAPLDKALTCRNCERPRARPDIVLFGEQLEHARTRRLDSALQRADLVVYVGTSGNVWPVAGLNTYSAHRVLLNMEPWGAFDTTVLGAAVQTVPSML